MYIAIIVDPFNNYKIIHVPKESFYLMFSLHICWVSRACQSIGRLKKFSPFRATPMHCVCARLLQKL